MAIHARWLPSRYSKYPGVPIDLPAMERDLLYLRQAHRGPGPIVGDNESVSSLPLMT